MTVKINKLHVSEFLYSHPLRTSDIRGFPLDTDFAEIKDHRAVFTQRKLDIFWESNPHIPCSNAGDLVTK